MNKIQNSIFIDATNVTIENNKIIVIDGTFYFQGNRYTIKNKKIVPLEDKKDEIPF